MTALDIVTARLDLALEAKGRGVEQPLDSISEADAIYRACLTCGLVDRSGRLMHQLAQNDLERQLLFLIQRGWVHDKTGRKILFCK